MPKASSETGGFLLLLQQELGALTAAIRETAALRQLLQENTASPHLAAHEQSLETALAGLEKAEQSIEAFLAQRDVSDAAAFAGTLSSEKESRLGGRLLQAIAQQQKALKQSLARARSLLEQGRGFAAFHVNVMAQASAGDTYAPTGNEAAPPPSQGHKIFEANI